MNSFFFSFTPIFHSIREDEIIFRAGSPITETGLILSGSVNSIVNLYWGNSHIFGHFSKGQVFGESYAAIPGRELICDIVACEETRGLFDRQQLADYLAVDRSAMSNELSKMQKDGLITYHRNEFTLNETVH